MRLAVSADDPGPLGQSWNSCAREPPCKYRMPDSYILTLCDHMIPPQGDTAMAIHTHPAYTKTHLNREQGAKVRGSRGDSHRSIHCQAGAG